MLELDLFSRRNFSVGNLETFTMYAGLAILFFYLVIFLQQVAGYSALEAGFATLPVTLVMFAFSRRFGALADRYGPRPLHGRWVLRWIPPRSGRDRCVTAVGGSPLDPRKQGFSRQMA